MRRRPRPALIQGHPLQRYLVRRFQPGKRPEVFAGQLLASDSYRSSRPVSSEEAAVLLKRRDMGTFRGCFYRYDGHGIWAAAWDGGKEDVRTYLTPRARRWPYPCRIHLQRRRACA